jgi:hypothetical protein
LLSSPLRLKEVDRQKRNPGQPPAHSFIIKQL